MPRYDRLDQLSTAPSLEGTIVPGYGPQPSAVLVVGEAPGKLEAVRKRPFVGPSGEEQETYLRRCGLSTAGWRLNNVVGEYHDGNPDPSADDIAYWTPRLAAEIRSTAPRLILAVGRFAMRWFLGDKASLDMCYGIPHRAGAFDPTRRDRGGPHDAIIVPIYHPAAGLHSPDKRAVVFHGYERFAAIHRTVMGGGEPRFPMDEYEGAEDYRDVTGAQLAEILLDRHDTSAEFSLDTEGMVDAPWSVQISTAPGNGYLLRYSQPDFARGAAAILESARGGCRVVIHNAMYDLPMCRAMGFDLNEPGIDIYDTMYASYLLRLEPQGLKPLSYRLAGMRMTSYEETVGSAAREHQLEYLGQIAGRAWDKPEPVLVTSYDGTAKMRRPTAVDKRAQRTLIDYYKRALTLDIDIETGDLDDTVDEDSAADGADDSGAERKLSPVDITSRWFAIDKVQRDEVEAALGPFPLEHIGYLPLQRAVAYACRDTDATIRVYPKLVSMLEAKDLTALMARGMATFPVTEEMQATGLPASRTAFENLTYTMQLNMDRLQSRISHRYFNDRPFNPKSREQTVSLMLGLGLQSATRTKKGSMSTGKAAIEHLRHEAPAIDDVLMWREHQHTHDMFAAPVLDKIPADIDIANITTQILQTRTTSRRYATKNPNLLAISKHDKAKGCSDFPHRIRDFGKRIRGCYVCPPGDVFLECDHSQIEVRMLAHESADPLLCKLFTEIDPATGKPRDAHTETAARIFGVPSSDITKDDPRRSLAKRVTFGIAYGVSGMGLETQLRMIGVKGFDARECERLINEWLKLYKGCAKYFNDVEQSVIRLGYVRDVWGMYRYLPGVWARERRIAAEARRHAVNHRIQAGAQGLIQNAMAWLREPIRDLQQAGLRVKWSLQLHDALMLQVDEDIVDYVREVVLEGMTQHCDMTLRVPILADSKIAQSWGDI